MASLIEPYAQALADYKASQGRGWREQLMRDWLSDHPRQRGLLRSLRNDPRFHGFHDILEQFDAHQKGL